METILFHPWPDVLTHLEGALTDVGLDTVQSFELHSARESLLHPELCSCPYHQTTQCSCQYIILIVQQDGHTPFSLEIHGYGDKTFVTLVQPTDGVVDTSAINLVRHAIDQLALVGNPHSP